MCSSRNYPTISRTHRLSETKRCSLLTKQYFRVCHLPPQRGRNGVLIQSGSRDHISTGRRRTARPSLFKHPYDAGDTRSKELPWPGAEAVMELLLALSSPGVGFCHFLSSPTHRANSTAGDFTMWLCFPHTPTLRCACTHADTGAHISDPFICCNAASVVNTSILLQ